MRTVHMIAAGLLATGVAPAPVVAQGYPSKAVRVIVPTAAGGNPDFIVRPVAQKMSESLKQPFIIDNRAGANGIIGLDIAAKAPPDGYTILLGAIGHFATNHAINEKLPFDVLRDFVPITNLVNAPFALFVHPSLPTSSVREFVALAKARPGQLPYMSFGVGSFPHFLMELFGSMTGAKLLHVPYKGSGPAAGALLAGQVVAGFDALPSTMPHVRVKRLRALAIGAATRSPVAQEVPTFAEAGYPTVTASAWYGLWAPAHTPREVVTRLQGEAVKVLATAEIRELFVQAGLEIVGSTPEQLGALLRSDVEKFVKIARIANIRAD